VRGVAPRGEKGGERRKLEQEKKLKPHTPLRHRGARKRRNQGEDGGERISGEHQFCMRGTYENESVVGKQGVSRGRHQTASERKKGKPRARLRSEDNIKRQGGERTNNDRIRRRMETYSPRKVKGKGE